MEICNTMGTSPPLKLVTLTVFVLLSVLYMFTTFLLNQQLLRKFCVPLSADMGRQPRH